MYSVLHIPEVDPPPGLAVRPDVLVVPVTARIEDALPAQAVSAFKQGASTLHSRLVAIHRGAEVTARKLDLGRHDIDKTAKAPLPTANLEGVCHVPLDAGADFWARAEVVAKITEMLRALTVEWAKAKTPIRLGFRQPVARVRDVAPHRAELLARYNAQLRALTNGVGPSLGVGSWEIPDEVVQQTVSLEEVRLSLVPARKGNASREA